MKSKIYKCTVDFSNIFYVKLYYKVCEIRYAQSFGTQYSGIQLNYYNPKIVVF